MPGVSIDQALHIAVQHHAAGQLQQAEQIYRQILAHDPNNFDALQLLGTLAHSAGHVQAAIELMSRAVAINGSVAAVRTNLASALRAAGQADAALREIHAALTLDPNFGHAYLIRALILSERGEVEEAAEAWQRLIAREPANHEALANFAASCEMLGRLDEAVDAARRAVELKPDYAIGHMNLGAPLAKLGRLEEALAAHRRAIELKPDLVMGWVNLAFVASQLGALAEAEYAARRAIALNPNEIGGWQNLAAALQDLGKMDEAADAFARTVALLEARAAAPTTPPRQATADHQLAAVLGAVSATLLPSVYESVEEIDRWRQRVIDQVAHLKSIGTKLQIPIEPAPTLFALAYQGRDDLEINRDFASLVEAPPLPALPPRDRSDGKIRIGLISRFFRQHTIGRLAMGLVEQLDRDAFDVTVLSVGDRQDDVANFMRAKADHFVTLPPRLDVARQAILEQKLDLLYYADIGMDPVTYSLAFSRLAPVQCVTWGHPVTTGIPTVDHFISSESLEVSGSEAQYTENLVKLKSLAVYYYRPKLADPKTRAEFDLPRDATLYGCLQMLWKFHPAFDAILGEILRRDAKGIVLIVAGLTKLWDDQLMARFRRTTPDVAERIRFLPRQNYENFLALTSLCDIMLDPPQFGGGNTTYEALAFGVPVVTLPSEFLRGRITKALYDQMGLTDFVAETPEHYIDIAATLGINRDARAAAKQTILDSCGLLYENPAGVRELEGFFKTAMAS
jgi:predicted O-linked N-acetylglucosamine transferase (SPINDLY family)